MVKVLYLIQYVLKYDFRVYLTNHHAVGMNAIFQKRSIYKPYKLSFSIIPVFFLSPDTNQWFEFSGIKIGRVVYICYIP